MRKFDLGIRAGHLLTMKDGQGEVLQDAFIGIKGGVFTEIAPFSESVISECGDFLDRSDQIVMPGLVNGHTHLAMSLFRGYEDDRPFQEWLFERILPAEAELVDEEFVRIGVQLSLLECIRFGTTTVNDMYYFCHAIAQEIDQAGMRATVAWPMIDFVVPDEAHLGNDAIPSRPERYKQFHERYRNHPRIQPALGPHAPYTNGDEGLEVVKKLAQETGSIVHMHVCETQGEVADSIERHGKSPVQRLHDLGMLGPHFIAAHGVHLSDEEIEIYRKSGASIVHNPDSNLKLSSGIAPVVKYRKLGMTVGLGTDGAASNNDLSMFGVMDLATKIQKVTQKDNTAMVALDALNMATLEGAKAMGREKEIGSIEVGKRADLITLRTDLPHVMPLYSVLSQLVYAYNGSEVHTVICDGRLLFQDGNYYTIDPRVVYENVERMRLKVQKWQEQQ